MNQKQFGEDSRFLEAEIALGEVPKIKSPKIIRDWIFWLEQRPLEKGRTTLLARPWGDSEFSPIEITPYPANVRSRLHGYGGGEFALDKHYQEFVITWINDLDQCLWMQRWRFLKQLETDTSHELIPISKPLCLSKQDNYQIADGLIDFRLNRWIGVMEKEDKDYLVAFALNKEFQTPKVLYKAIDFLGYPSLSPNANQLAWVEWQKPYMPWDQNYLMLSPLDNVGELSNAVPLKLDFSSNLKNSSVFQPRWLHTGELAFAEDSFGWWNLMIAKTSLIENKSSLACSSLWQIEAEVACPQWISGISTISPIKDGIAALSCEEGNWYLKLINVDGVVQDISLPFEQLTSLDTSNNKAVVVASNSFKEPGLLEIDLDKRIWHHSPPRDLLFKKEEISAAESFYFDGYLGQKTQAWYYPPIAKRCNKSPLLVKAHSGPTAMSDRGLNLEIQFWTSRGWGVLDVNYSGSTGYGRTYRDRLKHNWGKADVFDCSEAAKILVESGKADKELVAIEGSSAGGFTALACLCFTNVFAIGACKYPVTDLFEMSKSTHRFEANYLDYLIGKVEESSDLYLTRSPINNVSKITSPVIFFQGLQDKVVLPEHTQKMFEALKDNQIHTELYSFANEGHGFRDGVTRIKVLKQTESFFRKNLSL